MSILGTLDAVQFVRWLLNSIRIWPKPNSIRIWPKPVTTKQALPGAQKEVHVAP